MSKPKKSTVIKNAKPGEAARDTSAAPLQHLAQPSRCAPLDAWLAKHGAVMLWETSLHGTIAPRVQAWSIQSKTGANNTVIVLRYGYQGSEGWDLFTALGANSVGLSLKDAEERLGLGEAPPQDWYAEQVVRLRTIHKRMQAGEVSRREAAKLMAAELEKEPPSP
jgi:hypothetical protein